MRLARTLLSGLGVVALGVSALVACSTTTNVVVVGSDGGGAGEGGDPSLPEVPIAQLGAACAGFGTSIGDTALFPDTNCAAGSCLVDARTGIDEYCSANCDKARCPTGYLCQATSLNPDTHACFRDPNAPATDGGTDGAATTSFLDARLPALKAGRTAQSDLALDDYADPTGATRDLVIVLVNGMWSVYDKEQMQDLNTMPIARAEVVSVLSEGVAPSTAATQADLVKWHGDYPNVDTALDPELAKLGPGLGTITAVPTWFVFSARTMKMIATEQGYMAPSDLSASVATWRAMAK